MNLAFLRKKSSLLALFLALSVGLTPAWAAFTSGSILEVNSGGSDTLNGGGFDPGATFATDLAATVATGTAPVVTSASYTFVAGDVNAYVFIKSGTNWTPGWYKIASVSGGAATLTATIASAVLYNGVSATNGSAGCATTASPTSGTWGIDYSRSTSARYTFTDMAIDGTTNTKFTSSGNPVGVNFVGNFLVVTSGTGFTTQYVEVLSVSGTTATCDKSLGTLSSTGGHGGLGGAFASPGSASAVQGSVPMTIFVVGNHTYTLSSSSNVSGGRITGGGNGPAWCGYNTSRYLFNTDSNRPIFQSNSNTYTLMFLNGSNTSCHCIDFENGNSNTSITAFSDGGNGNSDVWNCKFNGISVACSQSFTSQMDYCWVNACTSGTSVMGAGSTDRYYVRNSVFTANTAINFNVGAALGCVFYNNGSNGANGIIAQARLVDRCLFHTTTSSSAIAVKSYVTSNCLFISNSTTSAVALSPISGDNTSQVVNCGFYNNTTDIATSSTFPGFRIIGKIVLTGDPCKSPSTGDFSLNATAGSGAVARATGFPTTFANGLTTNALDLGPVQHADPTGSGGGKKVGPGGGKVGLIGPAIRLRKAG